MFSPEYIRELSDRAAARAAAEQRIPYTPWDADEVLNYPPFPFPNLGDYIPDGWQLVETLFCDSSGFGSPGEPALTISELIELIHAQQQSYNRPGYAIIETGQFQVVLGVFIQDQESLPAVPEVSTDQGNTWFPIIKY